MYSDLVNTGLSVLNRAGDLMRRGGTSDSLVDFTSVGRVEPLVLIEKAAMHLDCIGEVQQSLLSIFAGYYLQAASLSNVMGNIRVIDRLDTLNPNRNPVNAGLSTWMIATEAYEDGLPFPTNNKLRLSIESGLGSLGGAAQKTPGMSTGEGGVGSGGKSRGNTAGAMGGMGTADAAEGNNLSVSENGTDMRDGKIEAISKADIGRTMTELANLSVGKSYEIQISDGKRSLPVQVNIRLIASVLPGPDLIHILATGSEDNSFKERWHGWKSGRLSFWKDLVLCNDLVDKHRSDLLKDPSGTLGNIGRTNLNNKLSTLVSGSPTIASSTNMVVITKDTAEQLELQLEGKLAKFDIRQRMFKQTSLMMMAVVDEVDYNNVTFYHRNIAMPTTVRIKDLKASNKGSGPDIGDILKALMGGHAPSL
jgi:hypothetical protein